MWALPEAPICSARSAARLFFGWLTDRLGRKKLFFTTIVVYLTATALTGLSWNGWSFWLFRFLTGAGIGGEYTAINSTIQELVPARYRGFTDLVINGSFWIGAALGAGARDRAARSARHQSRDRMARLLPHRRGARPRRLPHAHVDSRKPALARAAWPGGASADRRRRHRGEASGRRPCARRRSSPTPRSGSRRAATRRSAKSSPRSFAAIAGEASSASR